MPLDNTIPSISYLCCSWTSSHQVKLLVGTVGLLRMLGGVEELTANRVGFKTQDYCSDFCPILLHDSLADHICIPWFVLWQSTRVWSITTGTVCYMIMSGVHSEVGCDSLIGDPLVVLADPNRVSLCPSLSRPHLPSVTGCTGLPRKGWNGLFL